MTSSELQTENTHHAILIGVGVSVNKDILSNADHDASQDRSLRGATADIDAVEEYLKLEPHIKISRLTATQSKNAASPGIPVETSSSLPTYDNVIRVLEQVIQEGAKKQTKHVYIHFAGHGTQRSSDKSLALVLYDTSPQGKRYMYGDVLADALTMMADHDMSITLVLDCCFSGSVKRTNEHPSGPIRFLEFDSEIDREFTRENPFRQGSANVTRDAKLCVNRLLNPQRYTTITACGPSEKASEIEFNNGNRRGALSYFLDQSLRYLRKAGTQITFQTLFRHLQAVFQTKWPQQSPMQYGNADIQFFQTLSKGINNGFYTVFHDAKENNWILNAGEVHGVHFGDEYAAYPFSSSEDADKSSTQRYQINLKVDTVRALDSYLTIVESSNDRQLPKTPGWFTWKAEPLTTFSSNKPLVHLMSTLSDLERQRLGQSLNGHPFLRLTTDGGEGKTSMFTVSKGSDGNYEVQERALGSILQISSLLAGTVDPTGSLVNMMGHLATYKFFQEIENQNQCVFHNLFSMDSVCKLGPDNRYSIKHGDTWSIKVTNESNQLLYFTIFNLRASWEIQNILTEACAGEYYVIPPGCHEEVPLVMEVPESHRESGKNEILDIMKVFITSRPISFPGMTLPPLSNRSSRDSLNQISKFVDRLKNNFVRDGSVAKQGWATRNHVIKTTFTTSTGCNEGN
ncbi:hypothetical protein ACHAPO_009883 [Fusarium lateritium]